MNSTLKKGIQLMFGIFLYSLGIAFTIQANLGVAPWDTFHQGLSNMFGITFGQASIIVGILIVLLNLFLKEKIGLGTVFNMLFIGIFIDLIFKSGLITKPNSLIISVLMLFLGMLIIGMATVFYIGAGFGSGPRDGLMVALTRKTNYNVGLIRSLIELSALMIGVSLGGQIGVGTAILAFCIGPVMQWTFRIFKFDVKEVKHSYIFDSK